MNAARLKPQFEFLKVKYPTRLASKIAAMRRDGLHNLQIIADFDGTCTHHWNTKDPSKRALSCHGIIGKYPGFSEEYRKEVQAMQDYYAPLEHNPSTPDDVRLTVMTDWWQKSHDLMIKQNVSLDKIDEMVRDAIMKGIFDFRSHASDFLFLCRALKLPTIILSAGISVVIEELLSLYRIPCDDLTMVVSNQTITNTESILSAFVDPIIHGISKKTVLKEIIEESVTRCERRNFIVLGDMPHDAEVIDLISAKDNVLSVGFIMDAQHLEEYTELYDAVVVGDHGFGPIIKILQTVADIDDELSFML